MRQSIRPAVGLVLALIASTLLVDGSSSAVAQVPGAAPAPAAPARPANLSQVLATVNNEPITRGELYNLLSRYPLPPGEEQDLFREAVQLVANGKLVNQFLAKQRVPVTDQELADELARVEKQLQQEGTNLQTRLAEAGSTQAELQTNIRAYLAWQKYAKSVSTDAELQKYLAANRDYFSGSQVRAGIIFIKADETATPADKEAAKKRLEKIKAEIDAKQISFADAANKYSEDPRNVNSPSGGDLGYFRRKGDVFEELAAAAFAMKIGQISNPISTEIGWLLVEVTDRKDGKPADFEQLKPQIQAEYMTELQERIINAERKTAKIDIKPMPADFFPKNAPRPGAAGAPAAGAPATGGVPK
ncbi:MAG: peptidylprolyl isomerase [Isosphaeraceae bacterium]|nr:peptidylprolyl isomerase [Isosphaeraceae bacterium]